MEGKWKENPKTACSNERKKFAKKNTNQGLTEGTAR
jgi:hypothetical protein